MHMVAVWARLGRPESDGSHVATIWIWSPHSDPRGYHLSMISQTGSRWLPSGAGPPQSGSCGYHLILILISPAGSKWPPSEPGLLNRIQMATI